ncbi:MAG: RdgB/HAM1 family non-canonical purine NTP pyrophosphatase [Acidobacteria bacterium]|nr:RdgB/HAM1 family non-canonical purine NTP pyrophosphatase [Acidobacteriota bacterium]
MKLLVATNNPGKIREMHDLLQDLRVEVCGLDAFDRIVEPAETGLTFEENAVLKAQSYARQTGCWALSDDSGLEVEALGGAPGVFSARYAGDAANDAAKIEKLLAELAATGDAERRARFVCAMAFAAPEGAIRFRAEGVCRGRIAPFPRGANGFGYDPVFVPDGYERTFGELPSSIKREISHRSRAIAKIIPFLRDFTILELDQ